MTIRTAPGQSDVKAPGSHERKRGASRKHPPTLALVSIHGAHVHPWHSWQSCALMALTRVRHAQLFEIVNPLFINSNVTRFTNVRGRLVRISYKYN